MNWMIWLLASAVVLAVYDLLKKESVRGNAVLPVLIISTAAGAAAYVGALAIGGQLRGAFAACDSTVVWLSVVKSVIVGTSWILTFLALRTLPITIATPIRATAPALVILIAFFLYSEHPSSLQWLGMLLVFVGFFAFSWAGRAEGVDFLRNHAVYFAVGGMLLSAASALFDKYVFQVKAAPKESVQLLFQLFNFCLYLIIWFVAKLVRNVDPPFSWRKTIPFVGIALAFADWLYFRALSDPEALISVGSLLRRFSVVITFFLGAFIFHEHNLRRKTIALALVLVGSLILYLG